MGRKPKPAEVRALFFTARASGATLRQAAAAAGVCRTTGHYWLAQSGGVRPRVNRPRPPLRLSLDEREAISRGLAAKKTFTAIAAELVRAVSTISREVARNSGPNGYRAVRADRLAVARTARPRAGKLADLPVLRALVEDKLALCWSPWQISRHLKHAYPDDPRMRVSHETIYTSLFVQTKAVLRPELTAHLRTRRVRRRPQRRMSLASRRSRIPNMLGIAERPAHVADRVVAGHWEGDLLVGRYGRSHLVTLVERYSRFLLVLPVPDATTMTVVAAVTRAFLDLPECTRGSLTWDRGVEMTNHADLTEATGMPVYFCDAYSPWQRGSNENTNGLLRQYFPKKTDLSLTSPERLQQIVDQLNQRPRERGMQDSRRGLLVRNCCDDRLKPPPSAGQFSRAVDKQLDRTNETVTVDTAQIDVEPKSAVTACRPRRPEQVSDEHDRGEPAITGQPRLPVSVERRATARPSRQSRLGHARPARPWNELV